MIAPAMYRSDSAGVIHEAKTTRENSYAKNAVENGLTTQLTNSVMTSPIGRTPT